MRWFTSDPHFGHRNIIEYCSRPVRDVAHMNEVLVERWNERVAPSDEVWVLGDVALGKLDESLAHISRLHGVKHLVPGNHDRCWSGHKKLRDEDRTRYEAVGFVLQPEQVATTLGRYPVTLCHFPYTGDSHGEDRYAAMRPIDRGNWLLHGHVHDAWKLRGRQLNVGADVWGLAPVSEAELLTLIEAGPRDLAS